MPSKCNASVKVPAQKKGRRLTPAAPTRITSSSADELHELVEQPDADEDGAPFVHLPCDPLFSNLVVCDPADLRVLGLDFDLFGVVLQDGFGIDLLVHISFRIGAALL
jgi:hypothetical protein